MPGSSAACLYPAHPPCLPPPLPSCLSVRQVWWAQAWQMGMYDRISWVNVSPACLPSRCLPACLCHGKCLPPCHPSTHQLWKGRMCFPAHGSQPHWILPPSQASKRYETTFVNRLLILLTHSPVGAGVADGGARQYRVRHGE